MKVRLLKDANLQKGLAFSKGEEVVVREVVKEKEGEQSAGYLIFSEKLQQVIKVPKSLVEPVATADSPGPTGSHIGEQPQTKSAEIPDDNTPETPGTTKGPDEVLSPGAWVSINRTIEGPSGALFNEGDILKIEQVVVAGDESKQYLIIMSPLDSRHYRLETSDCEPCESPVEVEPEPSRQERRCSQCNGLLGQKATFCNQCGAMADSEQKRTCINCHAEIPPGAKFCKKCGSSQEASPGYQAPPRVPMVASAVALPMGMICPNCNGRNIGGGQRPSWVMITIILVSIFLFPIGLLSLLLLGVKEPLFCADCGFSWKAQSF